MVRPLLTIKNNRSNTLTPEQSGVTVFLYFFYSVELDRTIFLRRFSLKYQRFLSFDF